MEHALSTDGFIPIRTRALVEALCRAGALAETDAGACADVFRLLSAVLHYEAHASLETLKSLYDPLDPDAPEGVRDAGLPAFQAFESAFVAALSRANFTEIDAAQVETQDATRRLTGLDIKASPAGIRSIRYFARGEKLQPVTVKSWAGLRKRALEARILNDVVVIVAFKGEEETGKADRKAFSRMRRGMRPGAVLIKHFRNVARAELVTLHPGATPRMQNKDRLMLGVPAIAGGAPVLANLWPALTVLAAVIAAYFGAGQVLDNSRLMQAVGALGGLVALGAFVMRQRMKFEAQSLRYQKQLADTVYFRNIANNAGVIDLLINAGEEQDAKEAMLAFWALTRAGAPMTRAQVDVAAEQFLRETLALDVDFEVHDALAKLQRLGLVTADADAYAAIAPHAARAKLDAAWDDVFKFTTASAG